MAICTLLQTLLCGEYCTCECRGIVTIVFIQFYFVITVNSAKEIDLGDRPGLRKEVHASYEAVLSLRVLGVGIA